jgi:hypothetical protein
MASSREELEQVAALLEGLGNAVPSRAVVFHERRREAYQKVKIRSPVHARRLLLHPRLQDRIREARELVALGEGLSALLEECDSLAERTAAVENLVRGSQDPAVTRAADVHLGGHRKALEYVGVGVDSQEGLEIGRKRAKELAAVLDAVGRAVPLFSEALQILHRLEQAGDLSAAALAADLKRWRAEFLSAAPSDAWIETVTHALEIHRKRMVANQMAPEPPPRPPSQQQQPEPQPPPRAEERPAAAWSAPPARLEPPPARPEPPPRAVPVEARFSLPTIEDLLSECREWATALSGTIDDVRPLADRKRAIEQGSPTPEAINALGDDVVALRARLREKALDDIRSKLEVFNRRVRVYTSICGAHPDLQASVPKGNAANVALPEEYSDFEESLGKAQVKFSARANNDQAKLHEALSAQAAGLREKCAGIRQGRRSIEVDRKLLDLETRIPLVPSLPQPALTSIEHYELCLELEQEFASLRAACGEGVSQVTTRGEELQTRVGKLQKLLDLMPELDGDLTGIAKRLEAAKTWAPDALLDPYDAELSQVDLLLALRESSARQTAEERLSALKNFFEDANRELSAVSSAEETFAFPEQTLSDAERLAELLMEATAFEERLKTQIAAGIEQLRGQLPSLGERVRAAFAAGESQRSGNSQIAGSLLLEYDELPRGDRDLETLSQVRQWTQQVEVFLYSIERERHDLQDEVNDLLSRIATLRRQGGDVYYPRWVRRVEALVGGVDGGVPAADTARLQLAEARRLLQGLERDSLHRMSEEVEAARTRIEAELRRPGDARFVQNARRILAELERYGYRSLPPMPIVRQLTMLKTETMRTSSR